MRYFIISYIVNAPTWNMQIGSYAVANATFPSLAAIAYHVRSITGAPATAAVAPVNIQEIAKADFDSYTGTTA